MASDDCCPEPDRKYTGGDYPHDVDGLLDPDLPGTLVLIDADGREVDADGKEIRDE